MLVTDFFSVFAFVVSSNNLSIDIRSCDECSKIFPLNVQLQRRALHTAEIESWEKKKRRKLSCLHALQLSNHVHQKKKQASKPQSHVASLCKHHRTHDCLRKWEFLLKRYERAICANVPSFQVQTTLDRRRVSAAVRVPPRNSRTRNRRKKNSYIILRTMDVKHEKIHSLAGSAATVNLMNLSERKWNLKFHSGFQLSETHRWFFFLLCVFFYCRTKNSIWQNARRKIW